MDRTFYVNNKIIHLIDEKTKIGDKGDSLLLLAEVNSNTYQINDPRYRQESDNISLDQLFEKGSNYENMVLDFIGEISGMSKKSLDSGRISLYKDPRTQEGVNV